MITAPKCMCGSYMSPTLVDTSSFGTPPSYAIEWECVHRQIQQEIFDDFITEYEKKEGY